MASTPARPTSFGPYLLDRKLAEGGMAEVFLARQQGLGGFEKQVVVKRILPALSSDANFVDMFLNEARLAARLSHSNVVQIFEAGEFDGRYYIAMEYIDGADLRLFYDEMQKTRRPTPPGIACRIIADLLAGLHYAHTRTDDGGRALGIVHRDVSPQNVLVDRSGTVKIVDFGIAKATRSAAQQTQAGQVKGKIAYLSPEQAMGRPLDARSDVFACGILLWELCAAARLFSRPNDVAAILAITEAELPPLRVVRPELPEALERVVQRALARPLDERYPSAQAMQLDLEALIRSQGWPGDRRSLERHMQERLGSETPSKGVVVVGSDPRYDETDPHVPAQPLAPAASDRFVNAPTRLAPGGLEAPTVAPARPRTPSGMRSMPATPGPASPQYLPPSAHDYGVRTTQPGGSRKTAGRLIVVVTAALLCSVGAIVALDWSPSTQAQSTSAKLRLEVSEPALVEIDGIKTPVEHAADIEIPSGRQLSIVAKTSGPGAPLTRTIDVPPASAGERIPIKVVFQR